MGIQGLLRLVEAVQRDRHLQEYAGQRAGIDAHGWLHAGLASCALEMATGRGSKVPIQYCLKRIALLCKHRVEPIMVFDGESLPEKAGTADERRRRRQQKREEGHRRLQEGDIHGARSAFAQAAEVTADLVQELVDELTARGVRFIVAPFEADAQLAYLSIHRHVDFCISEDSDLLTFGCERILYKMHGDGNGKEVILSNVLDGRSLEQFQAACVLMGCDYLPRVPRVGPITALQLADQFGSDLSLLVTEAEETGIKIPDGYARDFQKALETFNFQEVVDPVSRKRVPLRSQPLYLEAGQGQQAHLRRCPPTGPHGPLAGRGEADETGGTPEHKGLALHASSNPPCQDQVLQKKDYKDLQSLHLVKQDTSPAPRSPEYGGHSFRHSDFISETWEPPRFCKRPRMSLQEFLRLEEESPLNPKRGEVPRLRDRAVVWDSATPPRTRTRSPFAASPKGAAMKVPYQRHRLRREEVSWKD